MAEEHLDTDFKDLKNLLRSRHFHTIGARLAEIGYRKWFKTSKLEIRVWTGFAKGKPPKLRKTNFEQIRVQLVSAKGRVLMRMKHIARPKGWLGLLGEQIELLEELINSYSLCSICNSTVGVRLQANSILWVCEKNQNHRWIIKLSKSLGKYIQKPPPGS